MHCICTCHPAQEEPLANRYFVLGTCWYLLSGTYLLLQVLAIFWYHRAMAQKACNLFTLDKRTQLASSLCALKSEKGMWIVDRSPWQLDIFQEHHIKCNLMSTLHIPVLKPLPRTPAGEGKKGPPGM